MKAKPNAAFPPSATKAKAPAPQREESFMNRDDFHELEFCITRIEFPGVMPVHPTRAGLDAMSRIACPVNRDWRYAALRTSILSG
jgi:hypothetical protein